MEIVLRQTPDAAELFLAVEDTFDPTGIMNPVKKLPARSGTRTDPA